MTKDWFDILLYSVWPYEKDEIDSDFVHDLENVADEINNNKKLNKRTELIKTWLTGKQLYFPQTINRITDYLTVYQKVDDAVNKVKDEIQKVTFDKEQRGKYLDSLT